MEFLNTLFNYEYFGPILFAIIAVLIVLFFIVLFFGKKDEKERKLEETRRLEELANVNAFKEEIDAEEVKVEFSEEPVFDKLFVNENESLANDIFEPEFENVATIEEVEEKQTEPVLMPVEEPAIINMTEFEEFMPVSEVEVVEDIKEEPVFKIEPSIPTNIPKYDFEKLANSIAKELEELERYNNSLTLEKEEPVLIKPELELENSNVKITEIKDLQKKSNSVPIFSSVFVNKNEELNNPVEKNEESNNELAMEIKETIKEVEVVEDPVKSVEETKIDFSKLRSETVSVSKPSVDLPKHIELPKKAVEKTTTESIVPDLSAIEGETYDIN